KRNLIMATTAVIGLSAGKRLLSSSFYYSDLTDKLSCSNDLGLAHHQVAPTKNVINVKKSPGYSPSFISNRDTHPIKALKEHVDTASDPSTTEPRPQRFDESSDPEFPVEALLLLQKSMLEKQWNLSAEQTILFSTHREKPCKKLQVTCSGISARRRRIDTRKRIANRRSSALHLSTSKHLRSIICPELVQNRLRGYVKGVISEELLTHSEVVQLSKKIKVRLHIEERRSRLRERLGCEPSEEQLVASLRISRAELQSKLIECSLAREKLAMSNVRLVMSIAQRYDNMGAEMADLIQGGLIGLLRGIEKFDSSKGFKISTYVYWWIRQVACNNLFLTPQKVIPRNQLIELLRQLVINCADAKTWSEHTAVVPTERELYPSTGWPPISPSCDPGIKIRFKHRVFTLDLILKEYERGVSRALVDNSRTLRLPTHLHERLSLIRNAKIKLEEEGITPSVDRIAECLNMSQKKVRNATEAISKVFSLDREAFPSLNGLPGETLHSYIADNRLENKPWHGVDEWALKDEVNKLISTTLRERERDIIRLYYGLDNDSLTWEDISKRIGLSRERVRQVGLVALEKLKHAAKKRRLDDMLVKY
ncbi:hypothetical protein RJ639_016008, partial [Escallonia herrerae]